MKVFKIEPLISTTKVLKKSSGPRTILIAAVPIVSYMSLKGDRDTANTNNCRKAISKQKTLLDNGKITQSEFDSRKAELNKYYEDADKLPADVSSTKIKQKQPQFKGTEDDIPSSESSESDGFFAKLTTKWEQFKEKMGISPKELPQEIETPPVTIKEISENPNLIHEMSAAEIGRIDVSMCPELEEYLNLPEVEAPDGLMSNILDDLPEGFGVDEGLYSVLKGMVQSATDMLG